MSLAIWAKGGLVLLVGGAISGAIVGFTKLSPSTYSGSGVATRPRLVIARGKGAHAELSFNYDSFFGGGYKEGQLVPFNKIEMKFGNYQLKDGDLLCSLEQKGEYFVLQWTGNRDPYSRNLPTYKAEGYPKEVIGCNSRYFTQKDKLKNIKRVKLTGFRPLGSSRGGASESTIYVANCSFSLQKSSDGRGNNIMASGCTTKKDRNPHSQIQASPIITEYEVS